MSTQKTVEIKIDEDFEHLPDAPIVEAVIDIRVSVVETLQEAEVRSQLEPKLNGYKFLDSRREIQHEMKIEVGKPPIQTVQDLGWKGLRYQSTDQKHIVQFNRDGFVFSRLEPYQDWEKFSCAGNHLWHTFRNIAQPIAINRIGLRFINSIQLPIGEVRFENYLSPAPKAPRGFVLPFHGFTHRDVLAVPGHPYAINVTRTIQPVPAAGEIAIAVILDIDVFTTCGDKLDEELLEKYLLEMRWLKNKVFFGCFTAKAMKKFRGDIK